MCTAVHIYVYTCTLLLEAALLPSRQLAWSVGSSCAHVHAHARACTCTYLLYLARSVGFERAMCTCSAAHAHERHAHARARACACMQCSVAAALGPPAVPRRRASSPSRTLACSLDAGAAPPSHEARHHYWRRAPSRVRRYCPCRPPTVVVVAARSPRILIRSLRRHCGCRPVAGTVGSGAIFAPGSGPELRHRYRCPPLKGGNVAVVAQGAARRQDATPRREKPTTKRTCVVD